MKVFRPSKLLGYHKYVHILCDQAYENRSYLHIQFYDFEDTQLTLWVSYRYTNLTQQRLSIGL